MSGNSNQIAQLLRRLRVWIGNPLEWSNVDKSLLVGLLLFPSYVLFWALTRYFLSNSTYQHFFDLYYLKIASRILEVAIVCWIALFVYGFSIRESKKYSALLMHGTIHLYSITNAICATAVGYDTSPWAVLVLLGGPTVGLLLFGYGPTLLGMASFFLIIFSSWVLEIVGLLPYSFIMRGVPYEGESPWIWWRIAIGGGSLIAALGVVVLVGYVIHRWRIQGQELAEAYQDVLAASKAKDEFLSTVSHELRTPLTSIAGALSLIRSGSGKIQAEECERLLEIAHFNSERLIRLVGDLLDIKKIESGTVEFHMEEVEPPEILAHVAAEMATLFQEKRIDFEQRVLLRTSAAKHLRADRDRLSQVMWNVIYNAVKFSPKGGKVEAEWSEPSQGWVRFSVLDRGPGIPQHAASHIFEKFYQADSSTQRSNGGAGLGLAIVRAIVFAHGGKVGASNRAGGGAVFHIDLPLTGGRGEPAASEGGMGL